MTGKAQANSWIERDDLPPGEWSMVPAADLDALYRSESPRLARALVGSDARQASGDIVHDAFRRLLQATGTGWRPDRPGAYLARIVQNLVRERHRSATRQSAGLHIPFVEDSVAGTDPLPQLEARDSLRRIDAALAAMKPVTRDVFLLHRIDGLGYDEIGERMGMSVTGVHKHMSRALRQLRLAVDRS